MGERTGPPQLLHYRPWQGEFRPPWASVLPVARVALGLILRRPLFWLLYGLGMFIFLLFFFGQYLVAFSQSYSVPPGYGGTDLRELFHRFLTFLNGSGETYRTFLHYQGYIVMVVLALAGSILIGNDLRFGSLAFYLAKPLSGWHYLGGKALAVAACINLLTTLPALALYLQFGLLYSWGYLLESFPLALGIL